jgi:hypothetical protein
VKRKLKWKSEMCILRGKPLQVACNVLVSGYTTLSATFKEEHELETLENKKLKRSYRNVSRTSASVINEYVTLVEQ